MARPLPTLPRGPRGLRPPRPEQHLLACPRVSPDWEMGALRVLMKPHEWTRSAIEHRRPEQPWPPDAPALVEASAAAVAERLGFDARPGLHLPDAGDFWLVIEVPPAQPEAAKALALLLSKRLPGVWLTLDRLYVRDGRFFRRRRDGTFKFKLVPASGVHLPRAVRAALRGVL